MPSQKNIILYGAIAIIVVVAVFLALIISFPPPGPAHIDVSMNAVNYVPGHTYLFNNTRFNITIKNTGSSYVKGMEVGFYLNSQALKYYNVSIPAHDSVHINENYTFTQNGTFNFSAVANPSGILDIANSSVSYANIAINVSNPQQPNLYLYIPSNNTNSTYLFTLFPKGMEFSSLLSVSYGINSFKPFLGPDGGLTTSIMRDLSPYLNVGNGVYSSYLNGSEVYGLWLEGTIGNSDIRSILSTYSYPQHSFIVRNDTVTFAKINDTISFCSYSADGWTKLYYYYNATNSGTCQSMLSKEYNSSEYALLSNSTASHKAEYAKAQNFRYSNTTSDGYALSLSGKNYSIYQIFGQSSTGNFGSILTFHPKINISSFNRTCSGYIYENNSTSMDLCTVYYRPPVSELDNYSFSTSTAVSTNVTLQLYSFVPKNYSSAAMLNAAALFSKLNITNVYGKWTPFLTSSCSFSNPSLQCQFIRRNSTTGNYTVRIKNLYNKTISLSAIGCSEYSSVNATTVLNQSVAPGKTADATFSCIVPPVPIGASIPSYNLNMSYSVDGHHLFANGTLTYADFYVS